MYDLHRHPAETPPPPSPITVPRIGLALGSGGARGAAHVGVLRALEAAGIEIACIAGSSVGALVGGAYAAGFPLDEIERIFSYVRWRDLLRWAWPGDGLFDNSPLASSFERVVGSFAMADLKIPFAAVACDMATCEPVTITTGRLADAVRASTAIPFLVRPVTRDGRRLIDGGVLQKVPVRAARALGADLVIAVDLTSPCSQTAPARNPVQALMQVIDIMAHRLAVQELEEADVLLQPRATCSGFDFRSYPGLVREGQAVTERVLAAIRRLAEASTLPSQMPAKLAREHVIH